MNWSWGNICQALLKELRSDFKIVSVDYKLWRKRNMKAEEIKADGDFYFLSQNVAQLQDLKDYRKVICRLGGNLSFEDQSPIRVEKYLRRISKCFAVIATNEKLAGIARQVHKKVHLIPNGLNLEEWKFKERKVEESVLKVGFVGNVQTLQKSKYKGYGIIQKACSVLGYPLYTALYKDNQIPYKQMQEKFYDKIDVLVLLTDGEGCSNAVMEALACGIPVITTKEAGYHGEKMVHRENVLFCRKFKKFLISQLEELKNDKILFKKISLGGRKFAEEHHDIKVIAKEYRKIFLECSEQSPVALKQLLSKMKAAKSRRSGVPEDVTVMCVLKSGGIFTKEWVLKLKNTLERNVTTSFDFVCLTDFDNVDGCRTIKLKDDLPGWWSKIELFREGLVDTKNIIYFDLDTIILRNIDDLFLIPLNFVALQPWNITSRINRHLASGIMGWRNGDYSFIYDKFIFQEIEEQSFSGDQEYISRALSQENKTYQPLQKLIQGIFSYKRDCRQKLPGGARIVCFHGNPSLDRVRRKWVKRHWR